MTNWAVGTVLFGDRAATDANHRTLHGALPTSPDYETDPHSYTVDVTAFDGVNSTTKTITVNVTDVNDNAPVITTGGTQSVAENGTLVALLASTDADTVGTNPATFTVSGGVDAAKLARESVGEGKSVNPSGHRLHTQKSPASGQAFAAIDTTDHTVPYKLT